MAGPGLIAGAAGDDPSGIATYAQAGAQFGYGMLWTAPFAYPLLTAVQEACARIGAVTGQGLAAVIRENYSRRMLRFVVALILVANVINIGADLGGMAAAASLIVPLPFAATVAMFAVVIILLEVFVSYRAYARILKWLSLSLLSYALVALIVPEPWGEVLKATFVPNIDLSFASVFILTGVLGTTISPYMFFWEASEEVEEQIGRDPHGNGHPKPPSRARIRDLRWDNALGMLLSQVVAWFIILAMATVLHQNGVTQIGNAADAARALEPLVQTFPNSGSLAKVLFALGVVGIGLLAVPTLAGSASYAVSEAFGWREGLYRRLRDAPEFYGVITASTLIGMLLNVIGFDPGKALVFAAVFNGIAAVPLIFVVMRISGSSTIMGSYRGGRLSQGLLALALLGMAGAGVGLFVSILHGS